MVFKSNIYVFGCMPETGLTYGRILTGEAFLLFTKSPRRGGLCG